jgi:soluble lytic murein transglycosylase-like protein
VSAQAITGPAVAVGAGAQAAAQRVQQLQALIAATGEIASGGTTGGTPAGSSAAPAPSTDFASALQAATSANTAGVGEQATIPAAGAGTEGSQYDSLIEQAAARNGVDPAVLHGLIQQESAFDPNSTSSAGAAGLTQLMPGTASSLGVANPLDPAESIEGGARYLSQMMSKFGGNTTDALAAYNAGPGAVQKYGGVPPYAETQSYVSKVLGYAEAFRQAHPSTSAAGVLT